MTCQICGNQTAQEGPLGHCPRCLLELGMMDGNVPPTATGQYRLLEKIGEGGFGMVYLAEQEEPMRRLVALKIMKLGVDTPESVARFKAERQALAVMSHPNIATVFDAGTTNSGRPFFVMELVQGPTITRYCDERQLLLQERLLLFQQICGAIQHAHDNGIIHRDIKPSNILVTLQDEVAIPKVIDFGICKAMNQLLTREAIWTVYHQLLGTPAYMSPEQASISGQPVDARSDIYSLGTLLYELLTGWPPFDGKVLLEKGIDEARRTVREAAPARPSKRLRAELEETMARPISSRNCAQTSEKEIKASRRLLQIKEFIAQIRGDLDCIVMKCLEKEPARRYQTVAALRDDLQNYLAGKPIKARFPSPVYLVTKFVGRHKAECAAAVAALLAFFNTLHLWESSLRVRRASGDITAASPTPLHAQWVAPPVHPRHSFRVWDLEKGQVLPSPSLLIFTPDGKHIFTNLPSLRTNFGRSFHFDEQH